MIIVRLKGGLGNQLFQYAFGISMQNQYKVPLYFDTSRYKADPSRHFELDPLNLHVASETELNLFFKPTLVERLKRRVNGTGHYRILRERDEQEFFFVNNPFDGRAKGMYFDGYWQNPGYFKNHFEQIQSKLLGIELPANSVASKVDGSAVAIHVRRGDYLTDQFSSVYVSVPLDYYTSAMESLRKHIDNPTFYIFTDDVNWCQKTFAGEGIVVVNALDRPLYDLLLMSKLSHHIIANSTFSLWAAYLNRNETKMVIWPQNWFKDRDQNLRVRNLIPKDWISM